MITNSRFYPSFTPAQTVRRVAFFLALLVFASTAQAQFSSGSTGADGAFNPTANVTIQLPPSGVFNYTTVTIPAGVTVRYTPNALNTPVTLLAQGNVTISGIINIDGSDNSGRFGGRGGPGGFRGGNGGTFLDVPYGTAGDGPGGGGGGSSTVTAGTGTGGGAGFYVNGNNGSGSGGGTGGIGGVRYGTKTLLPLIGGSGGGGSGGSADSQFIGAGGAGGGGAILIASSTSISFSGSPTIRAEGGNGCSSTCGSSGGAIRLVANTISGSACIGVDGGFNASDGIARVEAFNLSGFTATCSTSHITLGQPNPVTLANTPTLRIASVGGVAVPANPQGLINASPDIILPTSVPNPVAVVVNGANLPNGTGIQVRLTPETGATTTVNGTLSGSTSSSTATVNLTLPNGIIGVIRATVTIDVLIALGRPTFINGEKVEKVEVATSFGGASEVVYILASGRRVTTAELQK